MKRKRLLLDVNLRSGTALRCECAESVVLGVTICVKNVAERGLLALEKTSGIRTGAAPAVCRSSARLHAGKSHRCSIRPRGTLVPARAPLSSLSRGGAFAPLYLSARHVKLAENRVWIWAVNEVIAATGSRAAEP